LTPSVIAPMHSMVLRNDCAAILPSHDDSD
jgi:hypothetical protein